MDATDQWISRLMKRYVEGQEPDGRIRQTLLERAAAGRPLCSAAQIRGPGEASGREKQANAAPQEKRTGTDCISGEAARFALVAWARAGMRPAV
jgi:hypothetical protein